MTSHLVLNVATYWVEDRLDLAANIPRFRATGVKRAPVRVGSRIRRVSNNSVPGRTFS